MAYRFRRREAVNQGVRRIAREQLALALTQLEAADERGIHEARKCLKRLRGLLRLVRSGLGKAVYRQENACFRDAARALSGVRDAQVLLNTFDRLAATPSEAEQALRDQLIAACEATLAQQRESGVHLAASTLTAARERLAHWPVVADAALWEGLERSYRQGRRNLAAAYAAQSPEAFHELRKRVKDLWYQQTLLIPSWPQLLKVTARAAHQLSDDLGDDHDLAVLRAWLKRQPATTATPLFERLDRQSAALRQRACLLATRLYAETPAAFAKRHSLYWQTWRGS